MRKTATSVSTPRRSTQRPGKLFPLGNADPFTPTRAQPVRVRARSMPTDAHFEPHAHPWAQLAYCASGVLQVSVEQTTGETTYIVPPSRAVWIQPGVQHNIHVMEAAELRTLYIDASACPAHWQACRVLQVSPLLRELIPALDDVRELSEPRAAQLSALILDELAQAPTETLGIPMPGTETAERPADRRLRALCEALLQNPQQHADLAAWSASVGASERTMHRLFRKQLGMSFAQWKSQVIIAQALPLLARGHSVAQVANATGYSSPSAFSAMFKLAMGQAPSQFGKAA